ncbi:MAG: LuxR C-terminal-related transcriptional regulator [Candidatus Nanoarchaeia archaeon]|nr:LuxR C-terminal-related transcriptional regulator [Candidatus Nanoarchaeia archaeon]
MLTGKEISVLELKKKGLKQTEIAKKMKISQPAVSNFYNNAMDKIRQAEQIIRIKKELRIK